MGQNPVRPVKNGTQSNHYRLKCVVNSPNYPKMGSQNGFDHHSQMDAGPMTIKVSDPPTLRPAVGVAVTTELEEMAPVWAPDAQ